MCFLLFKNKSTFSLKRLDVEKKASFFSMSVNRNHNNFPPYGENETPPPESQPTDGPEDPSMQGAYYIAPEDLPQHQLAAAVEGLHIGSTLNPTAPEFTSGAVSHHFETFTSSFPPAPQQPWAVLDPYATYPYGVQSLYLEYAPPAVVQEPYTTTGQQGLSSYPEAAPQPPALQQPESLPQATARDRGDLEKEANNTNSFATQAIETTPSNISPCFNLHGEAIQLFSTESGPSPLRAILQAIKSEEIAAALLERANNGVRIHYNINTSTAQKPLFDILTCNCRNSKLLTRCDYTVKI